MKTEWERESNGFLKYCLYTIECIDHKCTVDGFQQLHKPAMPIVIWNVTIIPQSSIAGLSSYSFPTPIGKCCSDFHQCSPIFPVLEQNTKRIRQCRGLYLAYSGQHSVSDTRLDHYMLSAECALLLLSNTPLYKCITVCLFSLLLMK